MMDGLTNPATLRGHQIRRVAVDSCGSRYLVYLSNGGALLAGEYWPPDRLEEETRERAQWLRDQARRMEAQAEDLERRLP